MTLFGMNSQMASLRAAASGERMHHAWLLTGPRGVGKATFADWAAHLLLDAESLESQGAKLLAAESHPDFIQLERIPNEKTGNLARNITVDQVRALRGKFATATALGNRRVVIIDSIDDMERSAANALLKSLEEPPASTIFLLVSHQPGRLLPTIRSRCRTMMFRPLDDDGMTSFIHRNMPEISHNDIAKVIAGARGIPALAMSNAALDVTGIDAMLIELAEGGDPTNAVRTRMAQSLSLKAALPRYEALLQRAPGFIASHARRSEGPALEAALNAWSKARALSQIAISQSLIAETVIFEMAGYVAALAPARGAAKA